MEQCFGFGDPRCHLPCGWWTSIILKLGSLSCLQFPEVLNTSRPTTESSLLNTMMLWVVCKQLWPAVLHRCTKLCIYLLIYLSILQIFTLYSRSQRCLLAHVYMHMFLYICKQTYIHLFSPYTYTHIYIYICSANHYTIYIYMYM